jgi:hypothetical protein
MWRVTNRVPIASIARPDDPILSFELPMAMTGLGQTETNDRLLIELLKNPRTAAPAALRQAPASAFRRSGRFHPALGDDAILPVISSWA